jgi:hypothetical protein
MNIKEGFIKKMLREISGQIQYHGSEIRKLKTMRDTIWNQAKSLEMIGHTDDVSPKPRKKRRKTSHFDLPIFKLNAKCARINKYLKKARWTNDVELQLQLLRDLEVVKSQIESYKNQNKELVQ